MMRRILSVLLSLLLLLPLAAAGAETATGTYVISCPEQNYSAVVNFPFESEYVPGDGLYVYTYKLNYFPYILIYVDTEADRVQDGSAFLHNTALPNYEESYKPNGAFSSLFHEDIEIAGHHLSALEVQYCRKSDGQPIIFLTVVDVRDDFTAFYRIRYTESDEETEVGRALESIIANIKLDNAASSKQGTSSGIPAGQSAAWQMFDLTYGDMTLGRACLPADYTYQYNPVCSVADLSIGNPWALFLNATSPDGHIGLIYQSARDYISYPGSNANDGQYDSAAHTPMLHYMNAVEYCDYWTQQSFTTAKSIRCIDENTYPEMAPYLRQKAKEYEEMLNSSSYGVLKVSDVTFDFAIRLYQVTSEDGYEYICAVSSGSMAMTCSGSVPGPFVTLTTEFTSWQVPYLYAMLCPAPEWYDGSSELFKTFMANTSVSLQFVAANQRLSNDLWDIINGRSGGVSDNHETQVMREETSRGDDYDDQFSDYILDRNDYTLSDGSHVKIPTGFDYVYEGDNGNVYFRSSSSAQPGGSTQLYPNQ